jgi:predicted kinase
MSKNPILIVISGLPCTGKTTIAKEISNRLKYPLIYKDGIKEILFDTIGYSNRSWSKKLSKTSYDVMFYVAEALLSQGISLVIEANFPQQYTKAKIRGLLKTYQFLIFEVLCVVEPQVLLRRFIDRGMSGNRHPGHMDKEAGWIWKVNFSK